jgi:acyl-CoA dehydrogenase
MFNINLLQIVLSDDDKEYQNLARNFVRDEVIPIAAHHDRTGEVTTHFFSKIKNKY